MKIKESCEDFKVFEIIDESILVDEPTRVHIYKLTKTNYTTERAVAQVAKSLGIPRKFISYAGTKDKNAITEQLISIKGTNREKAEKLELKDIELAFVGYAKHALSLGDLLGNRFEIVVKDLEKIPENIPTDFIVPNYFDEQRFSTNNVDVALSLVKRDFKGVVEKIMAQDDDFRDSMQEHLSRHQNDYLGAFRLIPRRIQLFYIHALQSKLFNDLLANRLEGNTWKYSEGEFVFPSAVLIEKPFYELSLIGYLSKLDEAETEVLKQFDIVARNFLMPSIPELSLEGSSRKAFFDVENCKLVSKTKNSMTLSFELGKGSYATIVLKQILAMNGIKN